MFEFGCTLENLWIDDKYSVLLNCIKYGKKNLHSTAFALINSKRLTKVISVYLDFAKLIVFIQEAGVA